MRVPENDGEMISYLNDVIKFIEEYSWIYKTRLTHILIEKVIEANESCLNNLGALSQEKLDQIFTGEGKEDGMKEFFDKCKRFTLEIPSFILPIDVGVKFQKEGLSPKKLHEVNQLGHFVSQIVKDRNISAVIDVGSGLGYVDREIANLCPGCSLIAIEGDISKSTKAAILNKNHPSITQMCTKITKENVTDLSERYNHEKIGPACVIALHACGDLTVDCFRLFDSCKEITDAVLVTCCYHKTSGENFPLSSKFQTDEVISNELFSTTFLRLASDRTKANFVGWDALKFDRHIFNNLARAVVELYLNKNNFQVQKKKRKWVRKSETSNWGSYLADWIERHQVIDETEGVNKTLIEKELNSLWLENKDKFNQLKGFIILQICFQSVAESFVLIDRLFYLREKGYCNSSLIKISEQNISPRSAAFIVSK